MVSHDAKDHSRGHKKVKVTIYQPPQNANWPEQVDWRTRAAITDIKDQVNYIIII